MGGYNQSARPQGATGELKFQPLAKFEVPSTGLEEIGKGISKAGESIAGGIDKISAKYAKKYTTPNTQGIEVNPQQDVNFSQAIPETESAQNMMEEKPSWFSQMFNFHRSNQTYR